MRTPRSIVPVLVRLLCLFGAACGGGDDEGASTDVASEDTDSPAVTTTTEESTTTTAAAAARTDIKPCELLTTAELEAQASVVDATALEPDRTEEMAANRVGAGAFGCTHYFAVITQSGSSRSEVTATLAITVYTKDPAGEYRKRHDFGERDRKDISGLGEKAYYDVENGSIAILAKGVVVLIDAGMPGGITEDNRLLAEAVAPIVLARL